MTNKKILIVDDDEVNQMLTQTILEGFDLTCVNSVDEAIQILSEISFCLIISDFKMPDKTGDHLAIHVKETYQDQIPFILLTGLDKDMLPPNIPATKILTKPIEMEDLIDLVKKLLV